MPKQKTFLCEQVHFSPHRTPVKIWRPSRRELTPFRPLRRFCRPALSSLEQFNQIFVGNSGWSFSAPLATRIAARSHVCVCVCLCLFVCVFPSQRIQYDSREIYIPSHRTHNNSRGVRALTHRIQFSSPSICIPSHRKD